jgi:hypothetical protein
VVVVTRDEAAHEVLAYLDTATGHERGGLATLVQELRRRVE